jgi:acetyl esterase/lipase
MKSLRSAAFLCLALCLSRAAVASTPIVMDLWPGKPPGDLPVRGPEKTVIRTSPLYGTNTLVTNVTKPTLTVYLPDNKERNTGTAMVICPGGGYWDLYWDVEGEQVAEWLNLHGITGIILKYRVPRPPSVPERDTPIGPQLDAQRAVSTVRSRAAEWGINPKRIGIVGFSVGGHLAIATATGFEARKYDRIDSIDDVSSRPDFAILCYSGFLKAYDKDEIWPGLHIPANTPPVMLVHASDDTMSNSEHSVVMYLALKRAGIPVEMHLFGSGEHDFGVRQDERLPSSWPELCIKWLHSLDLLGPPPLDEPTR